MNVQDPIQFKRNRVLFLAGGTAASSLAIANTAHAQSTAIDTTTVNTQLTAVQSGISGVGGVLLSMGMGILLFVIGKKIIKKVTSG